VEPVSFIAPRRGTNAFQRDLFPDALGDRAPHSAAQWLAGSSEMPARVSLDPDAGRVPTKHRRSISHVSEFQHSPRQSIAMSPLEPSPEEVLATQLANARRRIFQLETLLRKAGLSAA
jgi:hypothetical protein